MSTDHQPSNLPAKQIAALDLGSNSFHMLLVNIENGRPRIVEKLKEKVQLLGGASHGQIKTEAFVRGLACIERFKQRLAAVPVEHLYVMGTYVLRQARNADSFVAEVSRVLGAPLQVIDGSHEAELIYRAVAYGFGSKAADSRQLVIDIGGGSTEVATGQAGIVEQTLSVDVGCVALMDSFFTGGQSSGYEAAKQAALDAFKAAGLDGWSAGIEALEVIGTSGTIESVQTVLQANGWSWDTITVDAMDRLEAAIANEQWLLEAGVPGLSPDRVDIFPAGVAILKACFETLQLSALTYVDVSLLHGMVLEAIGTDHVPRLRREQAEQSIAELAQRFAVDDRQAARVERTALDLFAQTTGWWPQPEPYRAWLKWAARLHELGVTVNPRHYHRHGAYMLKHAEVSGLDEQERNIVALLIRGHRRSLPGLAFQAFDPALAHTLLQLVALLRVAVILERSHDDRASPALKADHDESRLHLTFADNWLAHHPLSARELVVEAEQLGSAGIQLSFED